MMPIIFISLLNIKPDRYHVVLVSFLIVLTIYSGLLRLNGMRYLTQQITFQEVPDEISLSFLITGCPLRCKNCHSSDSWNPNTGIQLDESCLNQFISQYRKAITCVLFMGGEWQLKELLGLLKICRTNNLKTCLYTGLEDVDKELKENLDYLKIGSWNQNLGNLSSPNTNQKLINLKTGEILNFHFNAQGGHHGKTYGRSDNQEDKLY